MKRFLIIAVLAVAILGTGYVFLVLNWNYSDGERAGWVQKFSRKGWLCKTWEGELAMVSMPGATPEKFFFTVWDEQVAKDINAAMGRRVTLHYQEKVGLPTSCFGDTRHFVNKVTVVPEIPLAPGIMVPAPPAPAPSGQAAPPASTAPSVPVPPPNTEATTAPPAAPSK